MFKRELLKDFLYWMTERHKIYLKKEAGEPWPWTKDPILQEYKFTNPFRENDKVTVWLKDNWRDPYADHPKLWFAMAVARQICHPDTLKELEPLVFAKGWNARRAAKIMDDRKAAGKQVYTGAYMIRAESDPRKEWYTWSKNLYMTEIVLGRVWKARKDLSWDGVMGCPTLEEMTDWFCEFHGWGGFMAYEVVTDLRHTHYLDRASDIFTWANVGPGARRGIHRLLFATERGENPDHIKVDYQEVMRTLMVKAQKKFKDKIVEMRDIEHSLCEFDKYTRVKNGEGRPRSKYNYGNNS